MDLGNLSIYISFFFLVLYLALEAQDLGIGIISSAVSRNQDENKAALGLLKPGIDGNEIWLFLGLCGITASVGTYHRDYMIFVVCSAGIGMLFRLAAPYFRDIFKTKVMMSVLSVLSVINVFAAGMVLFSLPEYKTFDFSFYTVSGCMWLIVLSIQAGALYGAVKVVNPLGERYRATALVTIPVSLLLFITLAVYSFSLTNFVDNQPLFYWGGSVFAVILLMMSFIALRMRKLWLGLVAGYLYQLTAMITISFSVGVRTAVETPQNCILPENTELLYPLLMMGGIISGAAFIYRMVRKKEQYIWNDYM